ncbi:MAG: hydroxymethylpyrimidine/phosphomethylpyrimidine kinase [bacterium]
MNILTIAGTDPSGGAGVQADLQVIRDHNSHGLSAVAAIVWQNTSEVRGWRAVAPEDLIAQLDAVFDDLDVAAIKIGMLGSTENAEALAGRLAGFDGPIVLDPVLASGDGRTSMYTASLEALRRLARMATLVTPNMPEAKAIAVGAASTPVELAELLNDELSTAVLLKVGHVDSAEDLRDVLADGGATVLAPTPRIADDVRGTGCQLSTAIACRLGAGDDLLTAVEMGRLYLSSMLKKRQKVGLGRPVVVRNHE